MHVSVMKIIIHLFKPFPYSNDWNDTRTVVPSINARGSCSYAGWNFTKNYQHRDQDEFITVRTRCNWELFTSVGASSEVTFSIVASGDINWIRLTDDLKFFHAIVHYCKCIADDSTIQFASGVFPMINMYHANEQAVMDLTSRLRQGTRPNLTSAAFMSIWGETCRTLRRFSLMRLSSRVRKDFSTALERFLMPMLKSQPSYPLPFPIFAFASIESVQTSD